MAPFMDREKVTKPTAQIGFIKFVLIPMFETVMKVSDEDRVSGIQRSVRPSQTASLQSACLAQNRTSCHLLIPQEPKYRNSKCAAGFL